MKSSPPAAKLKRPRFPIHEAMPYDLAGRWAESSGGTALDSVLIFPLRLRGSDMRASYVLLGCEQLAQLFVPLLICSFAHLSIHPPPSHPPIHPSIHPSIHPPFHSPQETIKASKKVPGPMFHQLLSEPLMTFEMFLEERVSWPNKVGESWIFSVTL